METIVSVNNLKKSYDESREVINDLLEYILEYEIIIRINFFIL